MTAKPYVGITGIVNAGELCELERFIATQPLPVGRRFMAGVLASSKSLRRQPLRPEWAAKYPDPQELEPIFASSGAGKAVAGASGAFADRVDDDNRQSNRPADIFRVIHYNSKEPELARQLVGLNALVPSM